MQGKNDKAEPVFAKGIFFNKPHENAPDFVKGGISIKVADAIPFLEKYDKDGWVRLDLKKSRDGSKLYLQLNVWERPKKDEDVDSPF